MLTTSYFTFPIFIYLEGKFISIGKRLIESEEKFRTISEESMVGISIIQDNVFQYINKVLLDSIGYTLEEVKSWKSGELFEKIIHPDERDELKEVSRKNQSGKSKSTTNKEFKMIRKNRDIRWIDIYSRSIIYHGRPAGMNISLDITKRKKAVQRLKESEEKFRKITEQSFVGVVIEKDFNIEYVNQQFATTLGYDTEELLKWKLKDFYEIFHPDDLNILKGFVEKKTKNLIDDIPIFQCRMFKKTGELIFVELFSKAITYQDRPANLAFVMDISELKKVEEVIREENKKLKELDNLRKDLITRVSHELRTPLTSMYGASQILLRSKKEDTVEMILPYIEISHRGSLRLKELVDNLLDTSRLETKKLKLNISNENLNTIINECIDELHYFANQRQVTINFDTTHVFYLNIDKHRFSQVLLNIISNAIKNTPPRGKIFVNVNEIDGSRDIIIKDTGVGITKEEGKMLFQKFGKIERYGMNLDVDIEGIGLGLYISK